MTKELIISTSAYQSGFGSAKFKSVRGLTGAEKEFVQNGEIVVFDSGVKSGGGNQTGTTWRQVVYNRGYWNPRVPAAEIVRQLEAENEI